MSVQSEITRLTEAKEAIASSIEAKGVDVPEGASLSDMPALIDELPGEGDFAPIDHTHLYAGSYVEGGAAKSANKIGKYVTISSSGSGNVGKYYKFGRVTLTGAWDNCQGYLLFFSRETARLNGILSMELYTGTSLATLSAAKLEWIALNRAEYADSVCAVKVSDGVYDLYFRPVVTYESYEIMGIFGLREARIVLADSGAWVNSVTPALTSSLTAVASKLSTARKITLSGDVTGSASFDGSGDVTIDTTATLSVSVPTYYMHSVKLSWTIISGYTACAYLTVTNKSSTKLTISTLAGYLWTMGTAAEYPATGMCGPVGGGYPVVAVRVTSSGSGLHPLYFSGNTLTEFTTVGSTPSVTDYVRPVG